LIFFSSNGCRMDAAMPALLDVSLRSDHPFTHGISAQVHMLVRIRRSHLLSLFAFRAQSCQQ